MAPTPQLAAPPSPARSAELANLDVLRATAVSVVFVGHMFGTMRIRLLGDLGHLGVLLFFVHTSLVLMMSMERLRLSGRRLYLAFMVRRIFRIFPLSVLCVLVVLICRIPSASWSAGFSWPGWPAVVSNLLLAQNLTHSPSVNCVLWSLPYEMQMYAVLPLLFALYTTAAHAPEARRAKENSPGRKPWEVSLTERALEGRKNPSPPEARSLLPLILLWLAAAAIALLEYSFRPQSQDFLLARYVPCFIGGVIAWRLLKIRKPALPGWTWVSFLLVLLALYRFTDVVRVYGPGAVHGIANLRTDHQIWWPPYCDLIRDWLFCAAAGFALPYFLEIRSKWLALAGKLTARYSYGIYVSHVPLLWLCFVLFHPPLIVSVAAACLATTLVSVLVYTVVESPGIDLGKRAASALVARIAPSTT